MRKRIFLLLLTFITSLILVVPQKVNAIDNCTQQLSIRFLVDGKPANSVDIDSSHSFDVQVTDSEKLANKSYSVVAIGKNNEMITALGTVSNIQPQITVSGSNSSLINRSFTLRLYDLAVPQCFASNAIPAKITQAQSSDTPGTTPAPGEDTSSGNEPFAEITNPSNGFVDANTASVTIAFHNLPGDVKFCLLSDQQKCIDNVIKKDGKLMRSADQIKFSTSGSEGTVTVCGDHEDKVKVCDTDGKDYFHAGNIYRIGAYQIKDDYPVRLAMAEFYVYHFYPKVEILDGLVFERNPEYGVSDKSLIKFDSEGEKNTEELASELEKKGWIKVKNPPQIILSNRLERGGKNSNNYQLVMEGIDNSYGNASLINTGIGEKCVEVEKDGNSSKTVSFSNSDSRATFAPGEYVIKVNEQINDKGRLSLAFRGKIDSCQGGFTYYEIPYTVVLEDGKLVGYINPNQIEVDPNNSEFAKIVANQRLALPCSKWVDAAGKEINLTYDVGLDEDPPPGIRCAEYETGLGYSFATRPTEFITTLGRVLLSIGTVGAFALMIYSGYIILLSRGDKEKIAHAREILTSAVTGLVFLILSIAILEIIGIDILHIPGFMR